MHSLSLSLFLHLSVSSHFSSPASIYKLAEDIYCYSIHSKRIAAVEHFHVLMLPKRKVQVQRDCQKVLLSCTICMLWFGIKIVQIDSGQGGEKGGKVVRVGA